MKKKNQIKANFFNFKKRKEAQEEFDKKKEEFEKLSRIKKNLEKETQKDYFKNKKSTIKLEKREQINKFRLVANNGKIAQEIFKMWGATRNLESMNLREQQIEEERYEDLERNQIIMKILMLFIIGINSAFYLYFLFKEMKKYRELVLKKLETGSEKETESNEVLGINIEEILRKNIIGVFITTFIMIVSVVNKEPFKFKNFSNLTVILMIFNALYFEYINRQLKNMEEFDKNLKKRILIIGNYVLPIVTIILIILQKLFVRQFVKLFHNRQHICYGYFFS